MYNREIQLLRGIAILAVIAFHSKETLTPNGYLGVDVFFLISGYLIIPRMIEAIKIGGLKKFYIRRFQRLAPATIFMLLTMLPLMLALGSWQSHKQYLIQGILTLFLLGNIGAIAISGDYFNPSSFMPLVHTWSLSLEEQMYIILPALLKAKPVLFNALSVGSFALFIFQNILGLGDNPLTFYMFFARIWEFHLGYLIYLKKFSQPITFSTFPSLIILVSSLFIPVHVPMFFATIISLTSAAIYILSGNKNCRDNHFLVLIGNRAYSLYLFHMPLIYLAKYSPLVYNPERMIYTIVGVAATILFAELCFRKVEYAFSNRKMD